VRRLYRHRAGWWLGTTRHDFSGLLPQRYELCRLADAQGAANPVARRTVRWPARVVVISEEWSSDCRPDMPMVARLAGAGDLPLRIFTRAGQKLGRGPKADPAESPNADIVNAFLNVKDGRPFRPSRPWCSSRRRPMSRENREKEWARFLRDWGALQESPLWQVWTSAAVDEILSALHERLVVGSYSRDPPPDRSP